MDLNEFTIPDALNHYARVTPDAPFLQWRAETPMNFAQVHLESRRIAAGLEARGIGAGETVLVMLPNSLELVLAWLGCTAGGQVQVPVNTFLRGEFLAHVLRDSAARLMVVHADFLPHLRSIELPDALATLVVVGDSGTTVEGLEVIDWTDLAIDHTIDLFPEVGFSDFTSIYYTSGTTGPAKGIMFTHGQGTVTARNYLAATGATSDDVFFCCMPLFHSNAQILQVQAPLMMGARVSIWPQFSATQWLDQVREVGATISNTLGVMAEFLHRQPPREDDADNPLRVVQTIPAPAAIVHDLERRFGFTCVDGYGLTDCGMVAFRRHDEPLVLGSSGRVVDDFEVVVADPDTDVPLPAGESGEIMIRPKVPGGSMLGYWKRPDLTVRAWRNLWFHTGDRGHFDADGNLFFDDRMGDSIRVRGENISSVEIEKVVMKHPDVHQCAAVATTSDVGDYDVLLFVVPAEGRSVDPRSVIEFCSGQMPYFAVPRYVESIKEMPMTPTQKILKTNLRKQGVGPNAWDRRNSDVEVAR